MPGGGGQSPSPGIAFVAHPLDPLGARDARHRDGSSAGCPQHGADPCGTPARRPHRARDLAERPPIDPIRARRRHRPRLFARAPERLRGVGRFRQPGREPELPGGRLEADPVDAHQHSHGPLHPAHMAQLRGRLHSLGDEPPWLSSDQHPPPRRQHRAVLRGGAPPAHEGDELQGVGAPPGQRRGGALLRPAPAPSGVGGMGDRAARRPLRPVLPPHRSSVRGGGGRRRAGSGIDSSGHRWPRTPSLSCPSPSS